MNALQRKTADEIRSQSSHRAEYLAQHTIPLAILGSTLLLVMGYLIYSYIPGDRALISKLQSELHQATAANEQLTRELKESKQFSQAQSRTIARLQADVTAKSEQLQNIKAILEGK